MADSTADGEAPVWAAVPARTSYVLQIETADGRTLRQGVRAPSSYNDDVTGAMAFLTQWAKSQSLSGG